MRNLPSFLESHTQRSQRTAACAGRKRMRRSAAVLLAAFTLAVTLGSSATTSRAQRVTTSGTSAGAASSAAVGSVQRMILLLHGSSAQTRALNCLLEAQQTPGSAQFHQWLTAPQFAAEFAPTAGQVSAVTHWLAAQGFQVEPLPASRMWIVFSGSRAQVEAAFQSRLTTAGTDAEGQPILRFAAAPVIPAALSAQVAGLASLDGVRAAASLEAITPAGQGWRQSSGAQQAGMTPQPSAAAIAGQAQAGQAQAGQPLTPATLAQAGILPMTKNTAAQANEATAPTAAGAIVAIPSRSSLRDEDATSFRAAFGLPDGTGLLTVQPDGADPGRTADEAVTAAMAQWVMAAAPQAQVEVIPAAGTNATDGLDLALAAAVNRATAHTILLGFDSCETTLSPAHAAFYATVDAVAAAEGMAVIAASGDRGAMECGSAGGANALASRPWNLAVGAAALSAGSSGGSMPVSGWEPQTAAEPALATGGGISALHATPQWQSAQGMPAGDPGQSAQHHRYLPDLVLPAASSGAIFCLSGADLAAGCRAVSASGSAIAAATMAGLAARIDAANGAQGNLAPNLYRLARMAPASTTSAPATTASAQGSSDSAAAAPVFADVTTGGNRLYCAAGGCGAQAVDGRVGYAAAAGFDLATGLGTVHAAALLAQWTRPDATGTEQAQVLMTNQNGLTYNPSTDIPLTAKVTSLSGGAVPTGTIQFYDQTSQQNAGSPVTLASDGTATYTEPAQFTIGGHNIEAIYSGDSTYASATSQPVTFNIQPSATSLIIAPSTTTPAAGAAITVTGTVTATNPGNSPPTGIMTVNLDGVPQGTAKFSTTSNVTTASFNMTAPTSGSHMLQGIYAGDTNYNQSTSPSVTISVAKQATTVSISATPSKLTSATPETFTATIAPTASTTTTYSITGTVSFYDQGSTLLGTATVINNIATLSGISTLSPAVTHSITAVYSGDTTWAGSTSSPLVLEAILQPVTVTLTSTSAVLSPGQAANLTATVTPVTVPATGVEQNPSGHIFFYAGTQLIGESTLTASIADTSVASLNVPTLPGGTYNLTAVYSGDSIYAQATSNALGFAVESFTITSTTTSISIIQGQTATVPYTITSTGGLTGPIQILCAEQNPPTAGAITCTFNPTIVNGTETATLTVTTYSGLIQASRRPADSRSGRTASALALAALLLLPLGRRRLRWLHGRTLALVFAAVLLAATTFSTLGCGTSTPSSSGTTTSGTPLGTATLQITGAAYVNNVTVSNHAYLTVNVTP